MTIEECFAAARTQFIQENQSLVLELQHEATLHASNVGLSESEFFETELSRHFADTLRLHGEDTTITVIKMYAPNESIKKDLLVKHLSEVADCVGLSLEEFLGTNRIDINNL